jgi:LCP family protein required for cell wall assembly
MTGVRGVALVGGKTAVALVSVLVLSATWYGWSTLSQAEAGVAKVDVIDSKASGPKGPGQDMNVLLVGMDSRTDAHGDPLPKSELAPLHAGPDEGEIETDTMIVVHVPGNGTAASAFSIPRDSYVAIAGQQGKDKINAAFGYGMNPEMARQRAQGVTDEKQVRQAGMVAGRKNLIQTVQNLTGVSIDHYAEVNLYGFAKISNAIGGVPVCLKYDTSDSYSGANFKAGHTTVQGLSALGFVRQRHGPGLINELDRERRQQVFLASMAHEILSTGLLTNPSKLRGVISAVQDAITLDKDWNLLQFAGEMQGLTGGSIKFNIMPVTDVDGNVGTVSKPNNVVFVDPTAIKTWVAALFSGTGQTSGAATTTSATPSGKAVTVDVTNMTNVVGLAGRVMDVVAGKGHTKGAIGAATPVRLTSLVEYAPDAKDAAQQVATELGNLPIAESDSVKPGHVLVLLGKAYHGPGAAQGFTGSGLVRMAPPATTTATPDRPEINAGDDNCIA